MDQISSIATEQDYRYPLPQSPVQEGWLKVTHDHTLYWHEYGNPDAEQTVIFIHGGPGGTSKAKHARFFNPDRYRIILYDQRGCGRSIPNIVQDPIAALDHNTTDELICDIEALRLARGVDKPILFGGSWGSTLALAYAIKHLQNVKSLILRGVFLCRKQDLNYFYQGNAATYATDPYGMDTPGSYLFYPEAWRQFVEVIPADERHDMVSAYARVFETGTPEEKEVVATAWSVWEGLTSYLSSEDPGYFADPVFAQTLTRIECHYFLNGGFLEGRNRSHNYLIENIHKIASSNVPVHIVQGMFDQICPRSQADAMVAALVDADPQLQQTYNAKTAAKNLYEAVVDGQTRLMYILTTAGHSQFERETVKALTEVMDNMQP